MEELRDIKCVVWDLDHTLWDGILLEGDDVRLRTGIAELVGEIDRRGILQSIASKNEPAPALAKLRELGLADYFLYPQIGWGAKSAAIGAVARELNLGLDTFLFIDDQPFERDEVHSVHPEVVCVDAVDVLSLLALPRMNPRFITEDSTNRRRMYLDDQQRKLAQAAFQGPDRRFLASLEMRFTIAQATERDLQRAEELTVRTNQLNSTGVTYSYEELDRFRRSPTHRLLVCELVDRYGSYGKIGLALVESLPDELRIKLLLMSCRVASRGVGAVLLSYLLQHAARTGRRATCDFRHTGKNRMMYTTLKFQGLTDVVGPAGETVALTSDARDVQGFPDYIEVAIDVDWGTAQLTGDRA